MICQADIKAEKNVVRCAIYCRVSTVDQAQGEFTSIDNQREMAEAYIKSQAGKNWVVIVEHFDDSGYSAGTTERPALQRLRERIKAAEVDVVVVYRLDRLSRSQLDFITLVEEFKAAGAAFVSVTESFNTDTAVGRLTMGLLATFAEFERASISQRTADKMGAARRRGRWTGGFPVLGYDVHRDGGRLVVNVPEAETVRRIFDLYLELGSLQATAAELNRRGWHTKAWATKTGQFHEGVPFNKNHLSRLFRNPLYIGRVWHRGQVYDGEQPAIVGEEVSERVQELLARNRVSGGAKAKNRYGHLLRGMLHCLACGCAMSPSVTRKNGRVFRYYVCGNATRRGWKACPHPSLPAKQIEDTIVERIRTMGSDPELAAETLAQVRSIRKSRTPELIAERKRLERALVRLQGRVIDTDSDREVKIEARLLEIAEELAVLEGPGIDKRKIAKALAIFDEVWSCLFPREQERVINLLVERIDFDAKRERVAITFKPTGICSLAEEVAAAEETNDGQN
jgi:site-specific DNA recombinase